MIRAMIALELLLIASFAGAYLHERNNTEQIVEERIVELVPSISARCSDGTYSTSKRRPGTCSHHGGVAEWIIKKGP